MNIKFRLFLTWLVFLLLSSLLAAHLWSDYHDAEQRMTLSVRNYSQLLAEQANGVFKAGDLVTQGVANDPRFRTYLAEKQHPHDKNHTAQLTRGMLALLKTMPGAINAFITNAEGAVLVTALPVPEGANVGDRPYFRLLADTDSDDVVISETLKGRASGRWLLQIARRLVGDNGEFLGIIGVSLGIEEQFSSLYATVDWPEGTAISLWNQQRKLLMRYPMLPDQMGKQSTGNLLSQINSAQGNGSVDVGPSEFDGRIRARAVHKLGQYPVSAVVAVPREHYFAPWNSERTVLVTIIAVAFVTACLMTILLRRQQSNQNLLDRERRQHQEQLESYGNIFRANHTAQALLSTHLRCVIANPAIAELLDRDVAQLPGQAILDFFPEPARQTILSDVSASLSGETRKTQICIERDNSSHVFILETSPAFSAQAITGVVVNLRDITVRALAERALQQREAELKTIFECEPDCVKVFDLSGRLRKINPAGIAALEADNLVHALSTPIGDLIVAEDRAAYQAFLSNVIGGTPGILQYRGIGLKGTPRHVETHAAPLRDAEGRIVGALAISRDISEQKDIEVRLENALEEQQAILDNGIVGLIKLCDRRIVWANSACASLLGYATDDLVGQSTAMLHPDEKTDKQLLESYTHLAKGEIWRGKVPLLHHDGTKRWFMLGGSQLRNGDSLWALVDITAQQAAEEKLRRSYLAIEQSPDGIVITNTRAEIEYVNRAFTETTGYTIDEMVGKNPRILDSGLTPHETFVNLWRTLHLGQVWRGEFINRTKAGEHYISQEVIAPVRQADGEVTHYLSISGLRLPA